MKYGFFILIIFFLTTCSSPAPESIGSSANGIDGLYVKVLGIAQDAGYPQAGCSKTCCSKVWRGEKEKILVSSLALINSVSNEAWLFDATPDFKEQYHQIENFDLKGIFLTHAHIGHYTGLMQLGREVMGTQNVPVYTMPRMKDFLENNGPWSQLVSLNNIIIVPLRNDSTVLLTDQLKVTPLLVPHRDEYSETVGYKIEGPDHSLVFIPDIDKWEKMDTDIKKVIADTDYALLDGSFYDGHELPGRDMSEIPHPFVIESMDLFADLPSAEKSKIHFIHFNHTNPLLDPESRQSMQVNGLGFNITREGLRLKL